MKIYLRITWRLIIKIYFSRDNLTLHWNYQSWPFILCSGLEIYSLVIRSQVSRASEGSSTYDLLWVMLESQFILETVCSWIPNSTRHEHITSVPLTKEVSKWKFRFAKSQKPSGQKQFPSFLLSLGSCFHFSFRSVLPSCIVSSLYFLRRFVFNNLFELFSSFQQEGRSRLPSLPVLEAEVFPFQISNILKQFGNANI